MVSCFDQGISERASEPLKVNQNILNQVFKSPAQKVVKAPYKDHGENCLGAADPQNENDSHKSNSKRKNKRRLKNVVYPATISTKNENLSKQPSFDQRLSSSTQCSLQSKQVSRDSFPFERFDSGTTFSSATSVRMSDNSGTPASLPPRISKV